MSIAPQNPLLTRYFSGTNIGEDVEVVEVASLDEEHATQFDAEWLLVFADGQHLSVVSEDEACQLQTQWRALNKAATA
ncbi:hypothetical protein [Thalassospira sp. CH_XMU1420-2]|uniref:hypothetical protein n=1 Tax=Thalassospira sp. CH_XMU1420-2 TaxID=3107769 RepID=UPI003009C826|tara:strand:- start:2122 stop:2355 length:234 start_codon:yes stop_codon:yes gene_type:complete